ncbi:PAS domain S-box protein [Falsibacillus albus]|nr:PAS domain S-box protein [Falsibacillus albus]
MMKTFPNELCSMMINQIPYPSYVVSAQGELLVFNHLFAAEMNDFLHSEENREQILSTSPLNQNVSIEAANGTIHHYLLKMDKSMIDQEEMYFCQLIKEEPPPQIHVHELKEHKLSSFIHLHPEAVFYMSDDGRILHMNPSAERLTSFLKDEKYGISFLSLLHKDDHCQHQREFARSLSGSPQHSSLRIIDKYRICHNVDFTYIPIGTGIYGVAKDKTKRMIIENELKEVKELLEAHFENTAESISLLDENGNILKINKAFEKAFGWLQDEIVGYSMKILHKNGRSEEFEEILMRIKRKERIVDFETIRYNRWKKPVHVIINVTPIISKSGELIGMSSIMRDVTKQKQTEDLLKKSKQLALIGQLAAGVAHEVRNPLTTLKGFMQLLKEDTNQPIYFDVILDELQRIELITGEFISLAKPHAVNFKVSSLNRILFHIIETANIHCLKKNVSLYLHIDEFVEVDCDVKQVKQVLINVINNAVDAMPEGGELLLTLYRVEDKALITIEDTGIGIPADRMKHLGEPFYSTKEKGTGLGLMISNKIIKEHDGTFIIESEEGRGTKVMITLPIAK